MGFLTKTGSPRWFIGSSMMTKEVSCGMPFIQSAKTGKQSKRRSQGRNYPWKVSTSKGAGRGLKRHPYSYDM